MLLYHGGPHFLLDPQLPLDGHNTRGHTNGALGIWTATDPEIASRFGRVVTRLELYEDVTVYDMPIDKLSSYARLGYSVEDYIALREKIAATNPLIAIRETDGSIGQYILIDTLCVRYSSVLT